MLTDVERERDPAWLDLAQAHAEQGGDRWRRDPALGDRAQIIEPAQVAGERGADGGILPRDFPTPLGSRGRSGDCQFWHRTKHSVVRSITQLTMLKGCGEPASAT